MKIIVLTSTFPRWKGDTDPPFVFELCKRLANSFDIHVLAPHAPGAKGIETIDGISITRFRYFISRFQLLAYEGGIISNLKNRPWLYLLVPFFVISQCASLVTKLRTGKYDIIHAHWLIPQGLIAIIARRVSGKSVTILCTSHGGDMYALRGHVFDGIKRFVLSGVDRVTVVSRAMRDRVNSLGRGQFNGKTEVIPMGVDLAHAFVPPKIKAIGKTILFVGRLVEKKGVIYLIRALPSVLTVHPDAKLIIAGAGPDEGVLKREAELLRLEGQVTFRGAIENSALPVLYQSSDIVAFPSVVAEDGDREGFGLVQVEAMGCQCAVVATDLPAMRDIITDGTTGIIVREKNSRELAEGIIYLLDNPEKISMLGKKGREFVRQRYDWDIIAGRYREVIEQSVPPRGGVK